MVEATDPVTANGLTVVPALSALPPRTPCTKSGREEAAPNSPAPTRTLPA